MKRSSYNIEEIAKIIANGHSTQKHFKGAESSFVEKRISQTILDKETLVFRTHDKRDLYYNAKNNLFVSIDLKNKHGGTCFIPKSEKYFKNKIDKEIASRKDFNKKKHKEIIAKMAKPIPDLKIRKGGHSALYESKKLDKALKNKLEKEAERIRIVEEKKKQNEAKAKKSFEINKQNILSKLAKKEKKVKNIAEDKESLNKKNVLAKLEEKEREIRERKAQIELEKEERKKQLSLNK